MTTLDGSWSSSAEARRPRHPSQSRGATPEKTCELGRDELAASLEKISSSRPPCPDAVKNSAGTPAVSMNCSIMRLLPTRRRPRMNRQRPGFPVDTPDATRSSSALSALSSLVRPTNPATSAPLGLSLKLRMPQILSFEILSFQIVSERGKHAASRAHSSLRPRSR